MTTVRFDIPSRRLLVAVALCAGALASTGCHHEPVNDPDAQAKPRPVELQWKDEPLTGAAGGVATPVTVKEGSVPLVYLTEQPQVVQVVDRTANRVLGQTDVPGRTIVRIDERLGVIAGKEAVFAGPLDKTHRFAIVVVPQGEATVRSGQYQPVAPPRLEPKAAAATTDTPPTTPSADLTDVGKEQVK
jgi:hypothetical protein